MALDKLVDSAQLDADLLSVANAIRTKGGTSAQLAFPAGFVSAIGDISTGGGLPLLMLNHETIIPASDYTSSNKLTLQLTPVSNYALIVYAASQLTPPASGTIFLCGYRAYLLPGLTASSGHVLRAAGTVGVDGNFGSFNGNTGVFTMPGTQYSNLIAGETYEVYLFGTEGQ